MPRSAKKTRSPKKETNTRPSQRKGSVVKNVPSEAKALVKRLAKENNGVKEMRKYNNGSIGVFFKNGKFRFVTGGNNLKPRKSGSKVKYPRISKLAAKRALLKYYNNKSYKSPANRKAALTRDICSDNKPINRTSLYRRSPHLYDYPGVDDGSQCPKGHKVYHKKRITRSVKKNLLNRLKTKTASRKKPMKKTPQTKRSKSKRNQRGGDPLNDNDIEQIMAEYETEKNMEGGSLAHMGINEDDEDGPGMFADPSESMDNMEGGFFGIFGGKKTESEPQPESEPESTMPPTETISAAEATVEETSPQSITGGSLAHMGIDENDEDGPGMFAEPSEIYDMEGGAELDNESQYSDGLFADHTMDVDHEMEAEHMEGGGGCGANGLEAGCGMEADHGMDVDHEMEAEHMEGGGGCGANGLEAGCGMEADHGMDVDHEMEAEHMEGGSNHPEHDDSESSSSSESGEDEQLGGGNELSLKEAVSLLRDYYTEKYGN